MTFEGETMTFNKPLHLLLWPYAFILVAALYTAHLAFNAPKVEAQTGPDMPVVGVKEPRAYSELDGALNNIVAQVEAGASSSQEFAASSLVRRDSQVPISYRVAPGHVDEVKAFLNDHGASVRNSGADYIEALTPLDKILSTAHLPGVMGASLLRGPYALQGSHIGEGVEIHKVTAWHEAGIKGQGVSIGIIDAGFEGWSDALEGELPDNVVGLCFEDVGTSSENMSDCFTHDDHGSLVTDVAYDFAPEADFYIANPHSLGDVQTAVEWMVEQGVDVINMSLDWPFDGPGDGTSPFSDSPLRAVDRAVESGAFWANAAGNRAAFAWYGAFNDSDADDIHEFGADDECNSIHLSQGETLDVELRWDGQWGGETVDLDLWLLETRTLRRIPRTELIAPGDDVQDGSRTSDPYEYILWNAEAEDIYCLAVVNYSDIAPDWIQLRILIGSAGLERPSFSGGIGNPAESANPGLLAVGAASVYDIHQLAPYSSLGPAPDGRIKPDIVAATDTSSAIGERLGGTSQASPHIAGMAALVAQEHPAYSPAQIADYLKTQAEQRGQGRPNNEWGHGFAILPAPPREATPTPEPTETPAATPEPEPTATPGPGQPTPQPTATPEPTPEPTVTPVRDYIEVSRGYDHACALSEDGAISCWGNNDEGQTESPAEGRFVSISSDYKGSCAVRDDGAVLCWGSFAVDTNVSR